MKKSNSAFILPNIPSINNNYVNLNKSVFMTITDDMGFAKMQIDKINQSIQKEQENELKPWMKRINNNIYTSNGKSNYQIMKELSKKFKIIRKNKDIKKINWSKQSYYNRKQLNSIFDGYQISKKILNKYEVKRKVKDRGFYMDEFITQTKNISLDNIKLNILRNERDKINIKEHQYEKALEYEKKSLEKDINDFDTFKYEVKRRLKDDELTLIKLIYENKILYETNKKLSHEYKYTIEEIIRYIKLIINYKTYADFIHKLMGGGSKVLNVNLNQYVNFRNWSEKDLDKYIKNVLKELNIFIVELSLEEKTVDILSDNNRLDTLFKIMEENILKVVEEKEEFEKEEKKLMEENMINYNKLLQDYENNKIKYELYLKELEEEEKKIKDVKAEQGLSDFYLEMNILLEDLCNYVNTVNKEFNMAEINSTRESFYSTLSRINTETQFFYGKKIQNCINDLKLKEFMVEELINEINEDIKNDARLVKIIMAQVRLENRIDKAEKERKIKEIEEYNKKQNIINKIGQYIVREKYKFKEQIPYHILKERRKHVVKYVPESTETNLLYY
jgi:hypothetical protein